MAWFVQVMGEVVGPYSDAEFRQMAASGRVQLDTPVARGKDGPWAMATAVRGLFSPAPAPASDGGDGQVAARPEPSPAPAPSTAGQRYKVITQRDRFFAGKFDPDRLEDAINAYAGDGWRVCGMATTLYMTLAGKREEVVVLMERGG